MEPERVRVSATDGYPISTRVYARARDAEVIVIHAATGVPQQFYQAFASFLADRDFCVVTYDYRGIGDSSPASLRGFDALMRDWCLHDMEGVTRWVEHELAPEKHFAIGHSFGGQTLAMMDSASVVDSVVTVSAQSGHWALQGGAEKARVLLAVYVMLPVLSRVFGYFPWARFARGEDLPKGVALEWAGWCRHPEYLLGDPSLPLSRYAEFTAPVLAYSVDDDDWGTPRAVDAMMKAYPSPHASAHLAGGLRS